MTENPIFEAVEANDAARVRELLAEDPGLANARDGEGATPLHWAALAGSKELSVLLMEAGADVNAVDAKFGATPAGWAIEHLRERGGLLAIEIADARLAIWRGDAEWLERWITRLPALKTARDASGKSLAELAKSSGNPAVASLFSKTGV